MGFFFSLGIGTSKHKMVGISCQCLMTFMSKNPLHINKPTVKACVHKLSLVIGKAGRGKINHSQETQISNRLLPINHPTACDNYSL